MELPDQVQRVMDELGFCLGLGGIEIIEDYVRKEEDGRDNETYEYRDLWVELPSGVRVWFDVEVPRKGDDDE